MKRTSLAVALLATAISTAAIAAPKSPKTKLPEGEWELIEELSDEFNGDELDRSKWLDYHPYWSGRNPSKFSKDNIKVADGSLQILTSLSDPDNIGDDKKIWLHTGCVTSVKENCHYGYYEARIKACDLSMSNAFWFQSTGKSIEIDVTESIGNSKLIPKDSYTMNINTHDIRQGGWDNDITTPHHVEFPKKKRSAEVFYVYGVMWAEDRIDFYLDGKKVHTIVKEDFSDEMYMFFDVEAFKWQGFPTLEDLQRPESERTMYVDYVRAYRRR